MVVADNIQRIQTAKSDIRTSIINKWVDVPSNAKIDEYSLYIDQITSWWDPRWKFLLSTILRTGIVTSISSSDRVYFFWYEITYADNDIMILCRPRIYDDYSSSWHSTYSVYVDCWALDWTTLDFNRWSAWHWSFWINWSLSAKSFKCYRDWNQVHFQLNYEFYWSEYSDSYYVLDCIYDIDTKTYSSNEISVDSSYRLDNTWNMNLYHAEWEWSTSWKWQPILKWTPVLS